MSALLAHTLTESFSGVDVFLSAEWPNGITTHANRYEGTTVELRVSDRQGRNDMNSLY